MPAKASKRKATLGDDMPASPARKGEPVNLVVCRTDIVAGEVRLKVEAPREIQGKVGGKLLVKHVYRLQEDSKSQEEYRVLLRSKLGGKEHPPSLGRFGDNYALIDDYSGFLVHEYTLPGKGETYLDFEVAAEYTVGDWRSAQVERHIIKRGEGSVRVLVS